MPDTPQPDGETPTFPDLVEATAQKAIDLWFAAQDAEIQGRRIDAHKLYRQAASESIAVEAFRLGSREADRVADRILSQKKDAPCKSSNT